jgi:hypothetical protein
MTSGPDGGCGCEDDGTPTNPEPVPEPSLDDEPCPHEIQNWTEMVNYVKSQLGAGVVCVEVSDQQIVEEIENCIQITQRYLSGEGNYEAIIPLQTESGVAEYHIDANIAQVIKILGPFGPGDVTNWFSAEHHLLYPALLSGNMFRASGADGGRAILGNFETQMQYIKDIDIEFGTHYYPLSWREQAKLLTIAPTPECQHVLGLHVYLKERCIHLFNNILFKRLVVGGVGMRWARNLLKYASLTLPGGSNIAASELLNTYKEQYDQWLERIRTEGDAPAFVIG